MMYRSFRSLGGLVFAAALTLCLPASAANKTPLPYIGAPRPDQGMPVFDRIMNETLKARHIPGGALAIVKSGKLVAVKGYGLASVPMRQPVTLDTLFSTASVSKTITAAAVLRLVDQKKLSLDSSVYALLDKPHPLGRATLDPRVEKITVRQLLLHAGGWNSKYHPDVLRQTQKIARLTGEKMPLSAETVTRYGISRPLDFVPGNESHYSNFGYFLAKRIVQRAARQPYETFVRQEVLRPLGISKMRLEQFGPTYTAGEAHRYRNDGQELPGGREPIAAPAGSWLASIVDLARFAAALSPTSNKPLLSATARQEMFAMPPLPLSKRKSGTHLGLGWDVVRTVPSGLEYHKSGNMPGVRAYIEHMAPDIDWVLLLNSDGTPDDQSTAVARLVEELHQAIDGTRQWPQRDLF
jgi:CubicO group peptidase (beta-lactamase class C family)